MMASISDKAWDQFTAADYSTDQWRRACLVDTGEGDPATKGRYKVPVLEPDGTLNRNGVHAAAGGHGIGAVKGISDDVRRSAARRLAALYRRMKEDPPPSVLEMAGMAARAQVMQVPLTCWRTFPVEEIKILSRAKGGGDGRTVEAYAAVFNKPQEIKDQHGHYIETNDPAMFNRTISSGAAQKALVLYNHGFDARGQSGGLPTVPIGHPVDIVADRRGLLTVSRYNESAFADTVLESIKNGDITAQSYEGRIYRSDPTRVPRTAPGAALPKVRRMEMGLSNYGPTPTPYFPDAAITAVRSAAELAEDFAHLDAEQREELIRALSATPGWDPATAAILATPQRGPGTEDPRPTAHSVRSRQLRLRTQLLDLECAPNGTQAQRGSR
jgi:prohead serine protease